MANTPNIPMSAKERLIHTVLFEIGAVGVSAVVVLLFLQIHAAAAIGISAMISVMAMVWNVVFNLGFDHIFTAPRQTRTLGVRLCHTIAFEGGLLLFTLPVVAYFLALSLWQAFIADLGMTLAVMVYTLIFNFVYDHVRLRFLIKN